MTYNEYIHHRRSLRLRGYDYHLPAYYFVTTVTHHRRPVLGTLRGASVEFSWAGSIVDTYWHAIPSRFPDAVLDAHVVMPDHVHAILSPGTSGCAATASLPRIIRWFKGSTAHAITTHYGRRGASFWQMTYYDRIIRSTCELDHIRAYIIDNPARAAARRCSTPE